MLHAPNAKVVCLCSEVEKVSPGIVCQQKPPNHTTSWKRSVVVGFCAEASPFHTLLAITVVEKWAQWMIGSGENAISVVFSY